MKLFLFLTKIYFRLLNAISSTWAAKRAFILFQKVRNATLKPLESEFYINAERFKASWEYGEIQCYEMGSAESELVLLVHGWQSNAGSMAGIAANLAAAGKRVVTFDLPAHGESPLKLANLHLFRLAFRAVLKHIQPNMPFSIVAHSFGSAVTGFGLEGTDYRCKELVLLTSPNRLDVIFREYKEMVGLPNAAYERMCEIASQLLEEPVEHANVLAKLKQVHADRFTFIHDRFDKIIPFEHTEAIANRLPKARMIAFEKVGHYRMLWNPDVIDAVRLSITASEEAKQPVLSVA